MRKFLRLPTVVRWKYEWAIAALFWVVLFLPWLVVSTRYILMNVVPQYNAVDEREGVRNDAILNVKTSIFISLMAFIAGVVLAQNSIHLLGVTVPAALVYLYVFGSVLSYAGAKHYINQFLPRYRHNWLKNQLWYVAVSVFLGWWWGYLVFLIFDVRISF